MDYCPQYLRYVYFCLILSLLALGGQRKQEEDEQKQCKGSQHATPEDPQVQPRLRKWNSFI